MPATWDDPTATWDDPTATWDDPVAFWDDNATANLPGCITVSVTFPNTVGNVHITIGDCSTPTGRTYASGTYGSGTYGGN